jgi:SAM-dependent methyltransferase
MDTCRNCGQLSTRTLQNKGVLEPFFLKRVFGVDLDWQQSPTGLKRLVRVFATRVQKLLARIAAPRAYVQMQICEVCSFVQTAIPFPETSIGRLYADYRTDAYTAERLSYEPSYAAIAPYIGTSQVEIDARVNAETQFLKDRLEVSGDFTILDYGGADGKYIPNFNAQKFVYEISNIEPIPGVTRIHSEADLGKYSLVQVAHVIEHAVYPLELVRKVAATVAPGGFLYLEAPQDLSDEGLRGLKSGESRQALAIHEHINLYCLSSLTSLFEAAGLRVVAVESSQVDQGYCTPIVLRGLGRKETPSQCD